MVPTYENFSDQVWEEIIRIFWNLTKEAEKLMVYDFFSGQVQLCISEYIVKLNWIALEIFTIFEITWHVSS